MSTGGIHAPQNSRNGSQRTIAMAVSPFDWGRAQKDPPCFLFYAPTVSASTTSPSLTSGPPCADPDPPLGGFCLYIFSAIACEACCSASVDWRVDAPSSP